MYRLRLRLATALGRRGPSPSARTGGAQTSIPSRSALRSYAGFVQSLCGGAGGVRGTA